MKGAGVDDSEEEGLMKPLTSSTSKGVEGGELLL